MRRRLTYSLRPHHEDTAAWKTVERDEATGAETEVRWHFDMEAGWADLVEKNAAERERRRIG